MCDYSLQHVRSRAAKVGDKLVTGPIQAAGYPTTTQGLFEEGHPDVAVCLLPGTEVAFAQSPVEFRLLGLPFKRKRKAKVATFRQINKDERFMHHDALEFGPRDVKLVNDLVAGQKMTVLTLPAAPKTEREAAEQKRLDVVA